MNGIVGFKDLSVNCIIGILPEERLTEQQLFISLQIESNFSSIANNDNLSNAIDYVSLACCCSSFAITQKFQMLETLAHQLILHLQKTFNLQWIHLKIKKPQAILEAEYTFVELEIGKRS